MASAMGPFPCFGARAAVFALGLAPLVRRAAAEDRLQPFRWHRVNLLRCAEPLAYARTAINTPRSHITGMRATTAHVMSTDPKGVVREFATICAATQTTYTLYWHLFEQDQHRLRLYDEIASLTFHDLSAIVGQHLLLQFAKLTAPRPGNIPL